jgi:hypothetical protein
MMLAKYNIIRFSKWKDSSSLAVIKTYLSTQPPRFPNNNPNSLKRYQMQTPIMKKAL